jgi:hypothetical protein
VTGLFVSIEHNPLKAVFVSYEPKDHYQWSQDHVAKHASWFNPVLIIAHCFCGIYSLLPHSHLRLSIFKCCLPSDLPIKFSVQEEYIGYLLDFSYKAKDVGDMGICCICSAS